MITDPRLSARGAAEAALDPDLVAPFMRGFFGYGNWKAPLWFIGMEEGGGDTLDEIERRLKSWDGRGRNELEDLHGYHQALGITRHFGPQARIQSTWGKLARVALVAQGRLDDRESVRDFQRSELGRWEGSTALIELLPLPSPSTKAWRYADTGIEALKSRDTYRQAILPLREQAIRQAIDRYQPPAVVFYGLEYLKVWERISATDFSSAAGELNLTETNFIIAPHPVARGVSAAAWGAIGETVRLRRRQTRSENR